MYSLPFFHNPEANISPIVILHCDLLNKIRVPSNLSLVLEDLNWFTLMTWALSVCDRSVMRWMPTCWLTWPIYQDWWQLMSFLVHSNMLMLLPPPHTKHWGDPGKELFMHKKSKLLNFIWLPGILNVPEFLKDLWTKDYVCPTLHPQPLPYLIVCYSKENFIGGKNTFKYCL